MADNKNSKDEPSIEEILSSIRDIISDEDEEPTPFKEVLAKETPEPAEDDDVVDLGAFAIEEDDSDEISLDDIDALMASDDEDDPLAGIDLSHPEDDLDVEDAPQSEKPMDVFDAINLDEIESSEVESIEIDTVEVEPDNKIEEDGINLDDNDALVNRIAETATVGAMAKLAENIAVSRKTEGVTLEDIVRDLMRPMLKEWLDENLPAIIDRVVTKELERLAEKAIRK